ncbi:hypothetical protein N7499_003158 [Penicillium canescens]|uniref:Uncharacterized protein n=1 Tax=Penicillium canescens TaxID=5083 RepID=A0AAD6IAH4_PENCN|nr:uncharacterized protein N7446_012022 [Penicillium canescens]KAJ6019754.1 hypothetical protein N7522_000462 [Penicillium canescens]KAJ6039042.1 hypothetical protein N7460_007074 [Penicillium canescens]KAJ6047188.1 hypothetical protein N7446_012022 [Penicillium canescens]KAJ6060065.1 hypothetical protein N7444_002811 [Penicillium canescens]KAJ6093827.1 hypothetical protein N7499_003158 [Penicillium canescens]
MTSKPIWENAQPIVSAIQQLLLEDKILPYEPNAYGWQGVGVEMQMLIEDLKAEIGRKEFRVEKCFVFHFNIGRTLDNPSERLLIFPLRGLSDVRPGACLEPGTYWYISDKRALVPRQSCGVDVIIAVGEKRTEATATIT